MPSSISESSIAERNVFGDLLRYDEQFAVVDRELTDEQRARRQLDAVLIEQNINYLDSLNVQLDVDIKERIESDLIIEKITSTRLDAMQRSLVRQVEAGMRSLQAELAAAEERLRVATERLYQQDEDAAMSLRQMRQTFSEEADRVQNDLLRASKTRLHDDASFREHMPGPILESWRSLGDVRDVVLAGQAEIRERMLPLEHAALTDAENSVAQRRIRSELSDLLAAVQRETAERVAEERGQAAAARALTDALGKGLRLVNRVRYPPDAAPVPGPKA